MSEAPTGEFSSQPQQMKVPERTASQQEKESYVNELERVYPGLSQVFRARIIEPLRDEFTHQINHSDDIPVRAAIVKPVTRGEWEERYRRNGFHFYRGKENEEQGLIVLASAGNTSKAEHKGGCHAEMNVIDDALAELHAEDLEHDCVLISSVEPCTMCASRFRWVKGKQLIYATSYEDHKDKKIYINGTVRELRQEYTGYHVEDFEKLLDPEINVYGNYQADAVLNLMYPFPNADLLTTFRDEIVKAFDKPQE